MIRPLHLILGASLVANALMVGAYFHTRRALETAELTGSGAIFMVELALTPEQTGRLQDMRRRLRADLQQLRTEGLVLFETALTQVRAAKPGDSSYEKAVFATGDVRRKQTMVIIRELIAFREHLTPAQRETFNRRLGEWNFVEALLGFPADAGRTPPSGPFQGSAGGTSRNAR